MSENETPQRHTIPAPAKGLSVEEAYEYIDAGIATIKQMGGKAESVTGWLDFCANAFKAEPYGREIMLNCLDIKVSIMKAEAAGANLFDDDEEIDADDSIDELVTLATRYSTDKDFARAREIVNVAKRKALALSEEWDENEALMCNFDNPVEFLTYVNLSRMADDGQDIQWVSPNIANVFYLDGAIAYEEERFDYGVKSLKYAAMYNPAAPGIWLEMAECHKKLGDINKVLSCAMKARRLAWRLPDMARAHRVMAWAAGELEDFEMAMAHLVLAQDYEPTKMAEDEMEWLVRHPGFDVEDMNIERACELVEVEGNGCPASEPVAAAVLSVAMDYTEADSEPSANGEEVLLNLLLWNRDKRARFYAGASLEELFAEEAGIR